jgi:hypothetical protein
MATKQDVWRRLGTATRVLNTELKKEIIRQKAIDTGRMRNVSKIVKLRWDDIDDDISLKISSTEYYKFVDERKARKWKGGRVPRNITKAFMARPKVVEQLEKVVATIFEYRIDEQFK